MRTPLKYIIIPFLLKVALSLVSWTCRIRWHGEEVIEQMNDAGQPWVYGMWHNCSTYAACSMRGRGITCMVSSSRDGEYVARLTTLYGNKTVRGSSSKKSSSASRAILRLLRQGKVVAITPDGPRGPKYTVQNGLLWLAAAGQAPIVPFHIEASRQWVFNSWDNHRFPKPFSTIHIGIGKPTVIDRVMFREDPDQANAMVVAAMMDNVNRLKAAAANH